MNEAVIQREMLCAVADPSEDFFPPPTPYPTPEPSSRPVRLKQLPAKLRAVTPGTGGISVRVATLLFPPFCALPENQLKTKASIEV